MNITRLSLLVVPLVFGACRSSDTTACDDEEDSFNNPTPLAVDDAGHIQVTGELCVDDQDWYSISLAAGQMIEADLSFLQEDGDLQLELQSAAGDVLDESVSITDLESVRQVLATDQELILRVYGDSRELTDNDFTLDVQVTGSSCVRDTLEPNDSSNEPVALAAGTTEGLTVCFGEDDWYEIDVVDGQVLTADLGFDDPGSLEAALYRQDPTGALEWLGEAQPTSAGADLVQTITGSGPFLLNVARGPETTNADYSLSVGIEGEPCLGDAYEPNDGSFTAARLTGDTTITGGTICLGDTDWYEIDLLEGQVLKASLIFDNDDGDLALRVYKLLDDGTISNRATSSTWDDNEQLNYRPDEDGTYLVWVWPTHGSQTGMYDLDIAITGEACIDDSFEPNNHWNEAPPLTPGSYADTTMCVGDDDWYQFDASNGELINASITFDHDANDLGLALYVLNDDGTVTTRAGSNTLTDNESITYRPFEDGTFMLRTYRTRGTVIATYSMDFDIQGQACVPDGQEPNNAYPEAVPITPGNYPTQTLCAGDADWYEFDAENGQLINLDIGFTHADNDLGVSIYKKNDDGSVSYRAGSNTLTDNESIVYRPYDTGTFVAYVYRTRGTQVADYSMDLAVSGLGCIDDSQEPNDSPEDASITVPGSYPGQTLCVGDNDYYQIDANNGQLINLELGFTHADNDLGLRLYRLNADGTLTYRAGSDTLSDDEEVNYRPFEDGSFLVQVYRSRGAVTANYDLDINVSGTACVADVFEPNDAFSQTSTIADGTYGGNTLCVGDNDYFDFTASNGQTISAQLSFIHSENDLGLRIYEQNSDGTVTYRTGSDTLTDNEWLLWTPYQDGDYILQVYRSRGTTTANYDLDFSVSGTACAPDSYEPNDHWLQNADWSANVGTGTAVTHTSCVGDDDYFYIGDLPEGTVIDARAGFTHADNDFALRVYALRADNTLIQVTASDSVSDNEYAVYTVSNSYADRPYLVRVHRSRGTVKGEYDLTVDLY